MRKYLFLFFFISGVPFAMAQVDIPIGTWRSHLNYSQAKKLVLSNDKVFVVTGHSIFYLDIEDESLHKITKSDGLREVSVTALAYDDQSNYLLLGSQNGNLDLILDNRIYNIRSITNSTISGSKQINGFTFHNGFAYAVTDFGIPIIDLTKREIKETFMPGIDGNPLKINGASVFNDSIFIVTEQGIMAGSLNPQINLIDFRNWKRYDLSDGVPTQPFHSIVFSNNKLYAANHQNVYSYGHGNWETVSLSITEEVKSITASQTDLLITLQSSVIILADDNTSTTLDHVLIDKPTYTLRDNTGKFWIADHENGLVTNYKGSFQSLFPSGPSENLVSKIKSAGDKVMVIPYGRDTNGSPLGKTSSFSVFESGKWTGFLSYDKLNANRIPAIKDIVDIAYDPGAKKTYFASFGEGVLVWDGNTNFEILNTATPQSTLLTPFISSVEVDDKSLLWMINHNQNPVLHAFAESNIWQSYSTGFNQALTSDFLIYENGDKWLYSTNSAMGGIIVFNEERNQSTLLSIRISALSGNSINKLAIDLDGYIWVASTNGVAYFADPYQALVNDISANSPIYEGRRLFEGENIKTIAVDDANRKWIGTYLGLWLFNDMGNRLIHHFTTENSPLISNDIRDIEIDHITGEVFIATGLGLVSFRGTATAPARKHSNVKIFPNPVEPGFNGLVGISGLVENAQVKITDISGKMIWETRSHGGSATWKVTDYNGRRAASGVYLVFSSDDSGAETYVGKIAVIN